MLEQSEFNSLIQIILCLFGGLLTRFTLTLAKQRWAQTFHHTLSYILLPLIALVITKVISNNIALSLGMVGALSIVRFRNPVKNPLELVIYFKLITLGIAMSVSIKWGLALLLFSNSLILIISYFRENQKFQLFKLSFSEGDENNIVEILSFKELDLSDYSKNVVENIIDNDLKEYHYRFIFDNKEKFVNFINKYKSQEGIKNIKSSYV